MKLNIYNMNKYVINDIIIRIKFENTKVMNDLSDIVASMCLYDKNSFFEVVSIILKLYYMQ